VTALETGSINPAEMEAIGRVLHDRLTRTMVTGRFSITLVWQMAFLTLRAPLNPFNPINEIAGLEGAPVHRPTRTKPATKFLHPPLAGLWHKHFSEGRHVAQVVKNRWGKKALNGMLRSVMSDDTMSIEERSKLLATAFVHSGMDDQARHQKLTGDWIVYDRHDDQNTYLTLAGHNEDPDVIFSRVRECQVEFSDLIRGTPPR